MRTLGGILALAALCGVIYGGTLHNPWVWDDEVVMRERWFRSWRDLVALADPARYYSIQFTRSYRPLATAWEGLLQVLGGADPTWARSLVLGLHVANAALVARLAGALGASSVAALAAGLVLVAHPVNVEPVLNMTASADVLTTTGLLCALLAWRRGRPLLAVGAFAGAVLAKITALIFPALVAAQDRLIPGDAERRLTGPRVRRYLALAATAALFLLLRFGSFAGPAGSGGVYFGGGPIANLLTMTPAVARGLRLLLLPAGLTVMHEVAVARGMTPDVMLAVAGIAAWCAAAWYVRRVPLISLGMVWALIALLPVLNLAPFLRWPGLAERYLYLSSCGLALAVGGLWERAGARPAMRGALLVALVAGAVGARRHADSWTEPLRFYRLLTAGAPSLPSAFVGLGKALMDHGEPAAAVKAFERARHLDPMDPAAAAYLGGAAMREGRQAEAIEYFREAIRLDPRDPSHRYQMGRALESAGRLDDAAESYREALEIDPGYREPAIRLGIVRLLGGRPREAAPWMERVVIMHAESAEAWDVLGEALVESGRVRDGIGAYERAIALGGSSPALLKAMEKARRLERGPTR